MRIRTRYDPETGDGLLANEPVIAGVCYLFSDLASFSIIFMKSPIDP